MTNKNGSFLDSNNPAYIRKRILKDLETTFQGAVDGGKYLAAIRAKELQGRELGLFADKKVKSGKHEGAQELFQDLSDAALKKLAQELGAEPEAGEESEELPMID